MIAFISIFLGLVAGVQPVELAVSGPVAEVEIRLDGELVGRLNGEPWTLECDFGEGHATHELVAIARDRNGRELDRAVQLINVPRPGVDSQILLDGWHGGSPRSARLLWRSVQPVEPLEVEVKLDGELLADRHRESYQLPDLDPAEIHFLSARLTFPGGLSSSAVAVFGGVYGDATDTELTAVPFVAAGRKPRQPEQLQGRIEAGGSPLRVVAVEKGPAEVVIVRDVRAIPDMTDLELTYRGTYRDDDPAGLAKRDALLVMSPRASLAVHSDTTRYAVYPVSPPITRRKGSLTGTLARLEFERESPALPQLLTDAVATAGIRAAASQKRRAVVLLTADCADVSGQASPAEVRRFLAQLRVPLKVWVTGGPAPGTRKQASPMGFCDGAERIHSLRRYHSAIKRLRGELEQQRIAWVEGRHLQRRISLTGADNDLRLVE